MSGCVCARVGVGVLCCVCESAIYRMSRVNVESEMNTPSPTLEGGGEEKEASVNVT